MVKFNWIVIVNISLFEVYEFKEPISKLVHDYKTLYTFAVTFKTASRNEFKMTHYRSLPTFEDKSHSIFIINKMFNGWRWMVQYNHFPKNVQIL